MRRTKDTIKTESAQTGPLRGQMDIFKYIDKPRGYVENERAVKKRRSTVPGQINMFEYMDLQVEEAEQKKQAAILAAEQEELPGQMDILEFLAVPEQNSTAGSEDFAEIISENFAERISEDSEAERDEAENLRKMEALFGTEPAGVGERQMQDLSENGETNRAGREVPDIDDEDFLVLSEGGMSLGKIMRVLHISAMEAEQVRQRLQTAQ